MLGDRVKAARERLGLSQAEVARRAGVAQGTISDVEANKRPNHSLDVMHRLADVLGVSVDELLGRAGPPVDALDRALRELRALGEHPSVVYFLEKQAAGITEPDHRADALAAVEELIQQVRCRPQRQRKPRGSQQKAPTGIAAGPHQAPNLALGYAGAGEQVDCAG